MSRFQLPRAKHFLVAAFTAVTPAFGHAQEPPGTPEILTEDTSPDTTRLYQPLVDVLEAAGVPEEVRLDPSTSGSLQVLFSVFRQYIEPVEMEALAVAMIEGIERRLSSRPDRLSEAQAGLETHMETLARLETELAQMQESGTGDTDNLILFEDTVIEARLEVERAERLLEAAEDYQTVDFDILINAGLDYALEGLDPHTTFLAPGESRSGSPLVGIGVYASTDGLSRYRLENGIRIRSTLHPQDNTPAHRAGLQRDEIITHIDGEALAGLLLRDALDLLQDDPNTDVILTILGIDGEPRDVELTREPVVQQNVTWRIVDGDIVYIDVASFIDPAVDTDFEQAIEDAQEVLGGPQNAAGYITDLQDNGGGLLDRVINMGNAVIDGAEFDHSYGADISEATRRANTLVSTENNRGLDDRALTEPGDLTEGRPFTVLINGGSASASEIFASLVQQLRGRVLGIPSFGKWSVQTIPGSFTGPKITISSYYTGPGDDESPFGESRQRISLTPDVMIPFIEEPRTREADLPNARMPPDNIEPAPDPEWACEQTGEDIDLLRAQHPSIIDPRTGDYSFETACAVLDIRRQVTPDLTEGYGVHYLPYAPQIDLEGTLIVTDEEVIEPR